MSTHLSKGEIEKFKKRLEEMKARITTQAMSCAAEVKKPDEATGYSQHHADQGTDDFDRHINLEVTTNECELLKQIDHALDKILEGTYGICDITGEAISKARLEAMPYASTTVKAQEMLERDSYSLMTRRFSVFLCLMLAFLIAIDVTTKWAVVTFLPYKSGEEVEVFHNLLGIDFSLVHTINTGAAWGIFSDFPRALLLVRALFIIALAVYVTFFKMSKLLRFSLVLILSGALGNVIDFFVYGHVIDMFRFVFWGYEYPVFNIADCAITFGVIFIVVAAFFKKDFSVE